MFGRKKYQTDNMPETTTGAYVGSKNKKLICHFMLNNDKEAFKPKSISIYSQEVTVKKRTWAIEPSRIITDYKGFSHIYLDVNDSAVLSFNKDHTDKCKKCSGKMTVDAKNARDLVKRKTISALWGIDTMPMMLLIILGIVCLTIAVFAIYLYGDNQTLHAFKDATLSAHGSGVTTK